MATQLNFDQLKAQIENAGLSTAAFEAEFNKLKNTGGDVNNLLKTMNATLTGIQDTGQDIVGTFTDLSAQLKANLAELGKTNSALSISKKSYQGITSVVDKLKNEEQGIYDFNVKQLKSLQEKARVGYDDLRRSVQQLTAEERATEAGQAMLKARRAGYQAEKEALKAIEQRLALEKQVEKTIGATGAILDTTSKLFDKLGFGHLSSELDDLNKKLKDELRAEIEKSGGKAANLGTSFEYVGKAISGSAKILAEGLRDPLVILQFITAELLKGSQNMADFRKQTGMGYWQAYGMNMEMKGIAAASGDTFITSEKLNKSYSMLTQQLGVSADILGGDALVSATNLEQRLGMSAEQASKLTVFSRLQGKNTEKVLSNAFATVGAFNKQNKTAINVRAVMDDVANASASTYLNMGKNVVELTKAATKAASLGLSLKDLETVSDSLLDFESSIGKELEAQLLTGESLNLAKAREYAMTGDMKGLADEIAKQEAVTNAFKTKNVIAQKAVADALGLTVEQLAGITMKQELARLGAEKFKEAYGETAYEATLARSASEKFGDTIEKIKAILGSILQLFSPILDLLALILDIPLVPYFLAGIIAIKAFGLSIQGVGNAFGSMYRAGIRAVTGVIGLFKGGALKAALGGLKDKLVGGFGVGSGSMVQAKSGKFFGKDSPQGKMITNMKSKTPDIPVDKAESLAGGADKAGKSGNAEGFKQKMQNIAAGLKAFGNTKVLFGAFNLIPSSIGLIAMIPGIIGAKLIEKINGEKFKESMLGLATGIGAMGKGKVLLGSLGLILTSVGLIAMIPGIGAGMLLAATATPISMGLKVLGKGLEAFGKSMMTGYGLVGLAALAVGAIALGFALNLAAPGIQAFGTVITAVFAGLATLVTAVANGFVTMMGAVTMEKIGPMLLLGSALFGIAAGLAAIALAGPMAIPALIVVTGLAAVAGGVLSIFGGGEGDSIGKSKGKSKEGSMEGVEKKLDALILAVRAGGNVYLDTNKVGKAQVLGSYKLG